MPSNKKLLQAAAGSAGGDPLYVEDVFSTYLYTGNNTDTNIVNGVNLADEGGLVWIKSRQAAEGHRLIDSEWSLSANKYIDSSSTTAPFSGPVVNTFNTNGFQLDSNWYGNSSDPQYGGDFASWTFRKAEKFFDVVTYTGNGTTQEISHNLGSVPGCIIVKNTQSSTYWAVYHGSISAYVGFLNATNAFDTSNTQNFGNNTSPVTPTASGFTVGQQSLVNSNGETYVAYLFASDAGGFGDDGSENIIKCGSYTGNGSIDGPTVTLGFEPQWIMIRGTGGSDWTIFDNMRGLAVGETDARLFANGAFTENNTQKFIDVQATGFKLQGQTGGASNGSGSNYIYIAIRRPMKTPESGTEVFALQNPGYPLGSNGLAYTSGFPVDWALSKEVSATDDWIALSRLQGAGNRLKPNTTGAEAGGISSGTFDHMTGWYKTTSANMSWMFKRATGFFDVVAYTADSVNGRTLSHNLGVAPEMTIFKSRGATSQWYIWHSGLNPTSEEIYFNSNAKSSGGIFTATPTDASLFLSSGNINYSGFGGMIAYLFATLAGVSKVGSYTGTGNNLNVDCGFSAGARFILIKRTDATGDWYLWDSVRGISAGNDPYMLLNSAAVQVTNTDYIDPLSSGFTVTSSAPAALNASGGSYIFLAIA